MKMRNTMSLAAQKSWMSLFLGPFVALLLLAGSSALQADSITVTWDDVISVTDTQQTNQQVFLWNNTTTKKVLGTLDADGNALLDDVTINPNDKITIAINGQIWIFNASADKTYSDLSIKEKKNTRSLVDGVQFVQPASLVIDSVDYMPLLNLGFSSFQISGLQLYDGIPLNYFDQADFDSAAALAAGTLYSSIGTFTMNPDDEVEYLVPASPGTYDLMEVTGEQVLPGGGLGSPMTFDFADVPEPTTVVLLGVGGLALLRRRGGKARPTICSGEWQRRKGVAHYTQRHK